MSKNKSIENYFIKLREQNIETECGTSTDEKDEPSLLSKSSAQKCTTEIENDIEAVEPVEPVQPPHSHVNSLIETPDQPKDYSFPKTVFGKQYRSVQSAWFIQYPWLHYDKSKDSVFCYICFNQNAKGNLTSAKKSEKSFISSGFSNWKKALVRFNDHQKSECHQLALDHEINIPKTNLNIIDITNINAHKVRKENRHVFAKTVETLQFLGRQGIAIRGKDELESNFYQLLKLRSKDDALLACHLDDGLKYASHDIQNEIFALMANRVIRDLLNQIRENYYSLICDEYTDIANKEQLTLCFRWVDSDFVAYEDFVGFYEIPNIVADTIVSVIKDALIRLNLPLDKCRGQCYDGASNMMGKKSGVATKIQELQPKAYITHCHGHSLSLSVKDVTKSCKLLSDTMGTSKEIVTLIKYSPKRENMLGGIKDNLEGETADEQLSPAGIVKFCPTRWTVRATCYMRILDNYSSLLEVWDASLGFNIDTETRARILGCQAQMKTFHFYFGLHISQRLFAHTDNLSKSLQAKKLSATTGQNLADLTVKTLQSLRNEESFNAFYDVVLIKANEIESLSEPVLPRKRRAPSRYEEGTGEPYYPATPREYYRSIFYEALDTIILAIKERFSQPAFIVYRNLESLLVKASKGEDTTKEQESLMSDFHGDVCPVLLRAQLATFKVLMKGTDIECFEDILCAIQSLNANERQLIDLVVTLCKLIHVNPATSASGERSFSTARRVKTWLRSQMTQGRFNHLSILNTHKERLDEISLVSVANAFVSLNDNRKRNMGVFTDADFKI